MAQVPFCLVFTKMDKRKKRCPSPAENIAAFQVRMSTWLPIMLHGWTGLQHVCMSLSRPP